MIHCDSFGTHKVLKYLTCAESKINTCGYMVECLLCGHKSFRTSANIRKNPNAKCSACQRKHPVREPGYMFGNWKVLAYIPRAESTYSHSVYKVKCTTCGKICYRHVKRLEDGNTLQCKQCTMMITEPDETISRRTINFLSEKWRSAKDRCKPNAPCKKNYYDRGITMCRDWADDPRVFIEYAKDIPGCRDTSLDLDRIDNNKGYEPGNIRFCTRAENIRNSRSCLRR
jgi:hypothetical protein